MRSQSSVSYLGWFQSFFQINHFGSVLALSFTLFLSACGGGGSSVTENDLPEPGPDGVAPTLTSVALLQSQERDSSSDGVAKLGQSIKVDFTSSEAIMLPEVTINGVAAEVVGKINTWSASREMTESDVDGYVTFNISFVDVSGVSAESDVSETTDGSRVQYCAEGCVDPVEDPLVGEWMLDGAGAAGVGPVAGSMEWWSADEAVVADRACWFDDIFLFSKDGTFNNIQGDETWVEAWQGGTDSCGAPVAPHDGSASASWAWDEDAGTLTINGKGAHLGLAKAVNGEELSSSASAPESVTYQILTLTADGTSLTVTVETAPGVWWTFNLAKKPVSPFVGNWKLDGAGAAGVGPVAGSMEWWSADESVVADRACWFDDVFSFGSDGTFNNIQGDETWVEAWQGGSDSCAAPVAPHDGSADATFTHDETAGTLTITGKGAHLGLAKAVNGEELSSSASAPDSITYDILTLTADGMNLTVTVETAPGVWWTFNLAKVPPSPLAGNWKLDGAGSAGVGPVAGSMEWWSADATVVADRACWFDDRFSFGEDGSFTNILGDETWVEAWQGGADGCGTPVAPHDGSAPASFYYDEAAGQLTLTGKGAHLGLPKAVNGQELSSSSSAPDSVTYDVLTLSADGSYMSVTVETAPGVWWSFNLAKVPVSALAGSWALDGEGAAGVGPTEGSMEWWSADASVVADRACWFDDAFVFGDDGSFSNVMGDETWVEAWQGGADSCATPVAPHDGSSVGSFSYDETAGTITIDGRGLYLGLPKAVNGSELSSSESAPDSIVYNVLTATSDGKYLTVSVEAAPGVWWTFNLAKNTSGGSEPAPQPEPEPEPEPEPVSELGTGTDNVLNVGEVIDFNSTVADYGLNSFGNNSHSVVADPTDASNTVVAVIKGNETWAGTTVARGSVVYPLTATETGMTVRVWSLEAGITVRLKLEESTDDSHSVETDAVTSLAGEWETLTFDFSKHAEGTAAMDPSYVYDTLSIFLNYGSAGSAETYYFDDIKFIGAIPAPAPDAGSELVSNGDFQTGITGWEGGAAVANNLTSYFAVAETTSGEVYEVNLSQTMTLVPDTEYTVSFSAKSSIERTMIAGLGLYHDPWTNVGEDVSLTTEWQTYELVQVTTKDGAGFGDEESRILFDMGGSQGGQVWIDNVSVTNTDGEELVKNGDFQSGITDWEGGAAVADNLTSYFAVAETVSGEVYEVNLSQTMTLVPDTEYTVIFSAKSSIDRTMIAGLGLYHDPWTNVGEDVSLTTEWQTYELVQTTTKDGVGFGDAESRILFDMGGSQGGQVWIDNVSVK
jgi:hypothetical protein